MCGRNPSWLFQELFWNFPGGIKKHHKSLWTAGFSVEFQTRCLWHKSQKFYCCYGSVTTKPQKTSDEYLVTASDMLLYLPAASVFFFVSLRDVTSECKHYSPFSASYTNSSTNNTNSLHARTFICPSQFVVHLPLRVDIQCCLLVIYPEMHLCLHSDISTLIYQRLTQNYVTSLYRNLSIRRNINDWGVPGILLW